MKPLGTGRPSPSCPWGEMAPSCRALPGQAPSRDLGTKPRRKGRADCGERPVSPPRGLAGLPARRQRVSGACGAFRRPAGCPPACPTTAFSEAGGLDSAGSDQEECVTQLQKVHAHVLLLKPPAPSSWHENGEPGRRLYPAQLMTLC